MSYNLKDGSYTVGGYEQSVTDRKNGLAKTVALRNPGIVCLQESKDLKADTFASACRSAGTPEYATYQAAGGTTAVMWASSVYEKIASGSIDCTIAEGDGGDGYTRICTWVRLRRIMDGKEFYVVSAHFDLAKPKNSAEKLIAYLNANFGELPVIVAGDFNADETIITVRNRFKDADFANANKPFLDVLDANPNLTAYPGYWNHEDDGYPGDYGLQTTFPKKGTILDWCYYKKAAFQLQTYEVITEEVQWSLSNLYTLFQTRTITGYPSDHLPVYVELTFA